VWSVATTKGRRLRHVETLANNVATFPQLPTEPQRAEIPAHLNRIYLYFQRLELAMQLPPIWLAPVEHDF
jgi:hypothetical protein